MNDGQKDPPARQDRQSHLNARIPVSPADWPQETASDMLAMSRMQKRVD